MGDYLSILDSLVITTISMMAVFIILILISFLINGLQAISKGNEKNEEEVVRQEPKRLVAGNKVATLVETEAENKLDEELVAVIASTVSMYLGLNIPDVKIKRIKRVTDSSSLWASAGKKEQMLNRF